MLDKICQIARLAGHSVMSFYNSPEYLQVSYKSDKTPVTNVDREANNIIKKAILLITPNIPVISEEEKYDWNICKNWHNYWLVDPLDGTKEFLKRNGQFTINICLIKNSIPVLGVIYAPVLDILYCSYNNNAWKEDKIGIKKKISVSQSKIPLLVVSRSHSDKQLIKYLETIKNYKIKKLGSSLKFCLISEGKAQIYPRFGNTYIWDTAAGNAILVAAGGIVKTWTHHNLNYSLSTRSSFLNSGFYASVI